MLEYHELLLDISLSLTKSAIYDLNTLIVFIFFCNTQKRRLNFNHVEFSELQIIQLDVNVEKLMMMFSHKLFVQRLCKLIGFDFFIFFLHERRSQCKIE